MGINPCTPPYFSTRFRFRRFGAVPWRHHIQLTTVKVTPTVWTAFKWHTSVTCESQIFSHESFLNSWPSQTWRSGLTVLLYFSSIIVWPAFPPENIRLPGSLKGHTTLLEVEPIQSLPAVSDSVELAPSSGGQRHIQVHATHPRLNRKSTYADTHT